MKAISIRQPWAWLIVNGYKDIENRDWPTHYRGRVLIHAGLKVADDKHMANVLLKNQYKNIEIPMELPAGGIIGSVEIVDCVDKSDSPWFFGKFGFVLKNPQRCDFIPYKGKLGLFNVPDDLNIREMPL